MSVYSPYNRPTKFKCRVQLVTHRLLWHRNHTVETDCKQHHVSQHLWLWFKIWRLLYSLPVTATLWLQLTLRSGLLYTPRVTDTSRFQLTWHIWLAVATLCHCHSGNLWLGTNDLVHLIKDSCKRRHHVKTGAKINGEIKREISLESAWAF